MHFLHSMIRVRDLDAASRFFCGPLGLREIPRMESQEGRFTLVYLGAPAELKDEKGNAALIELTHNWDEDENLGSARNFGHLAFEVDDIYAVCARLLDAGVAINRPPRDGWMAFVRSPDLISIELLQKGQPLKPADPWLSMANIGSWRTSLHQPHQGSRQAGFLGSAILTFVE